MTAKPETEFGMPDDLSPEWTAYETRWSVRVADFATPLEAAKFLARRKKIFAEAAKLGAPKELLTPFAPDKPGFEGRIAEAFSALAKAARGSARHAAE
jgi:hypothetical protein